MLRDNQAYMGLIKRFIFVRNMRHAKKTGVEE